MLIGLLSGLLIGMFIDVEYRDFLLCHLCGRETLEIEDMELRTLELEGGGGWRMLIRVNLTLSRI